MNHKQYALTVAQAVRDARCTTPEAISQSDLEAIIATIPAPEPIGWANDDGEFVLEHYRKIAGCLPFNDMFPVYAEPAPTESVNARLLDAAKKLTQVMRGTQAESDYAFPMFMLEEAIAAAEAEQQAQPELSTAEILELWSKNWHKKSAATIFARAVIAADRELRANQ